MATKAEVIRDLCDLYQQPMVGSRLKLYLDTIADMSDEEAYDAAREHMKTGKWMPTPAEMWSLVREKRTAKAQRERGGEWRSNVEGMSKLRGSFRVPKGVAIMDYIEHLLKQGKTPDEIAEEIC